QLHQSLNQQPLTTAITQHSVNNYQANTNEAQTAITNAEPLINNRHPTPKQISHHKSKLQQALPHFNHPKQQLTTH
ncbi:FIVAR domain-containing protein, partial [Staphylococcus epidermidis]|uniref:FIVAR domain-containing protein n=1 Tax=Staphylococcus epidermidis TaxID=1282 RepID=UPI00164336EA